MIDPRLIPLLICGLALFAALVVGAALLSWWADED